MKYINAIFFLIMMLFSCQLLAQNGGTEGVEVINMEALNSEFEDFAPMPYGNKLMYTKATRKQKIFGPKLSNGTKMFTDVMSSKRNPEGKFPTGEKLSDEVNFKYFDGAPTFLEAGAKMIYSRSNLEGKNKQDTIVLKIYEATVKGDTYHSEKELPFNSEDYSHTHPTVSKDGKRLYFTSNRPGGYGGMDLWVSEITDGTWGQPKNLGAEINTAGNEIFPYIDMKDNLFYSSSKSGNLDIYIGQEKEGMWTFFGSLGTPFNSGADDMNYVANADGTEGYFASARAGGKGYDDIYTWKYDPTPVPAVIVVIDEDTKEVLEKATVLITPIAYGNTLDKLYRDLEEGKVKEFMTDIAGKVNYEIYPESEYKINASKENYFPKEVNTNTLELTENGEFIVPLKAKIIKRNLNGLVIDAETKLPIPNAKIVVTNLTTGKIAELVSDPNGKFSFEIDCAQEFKITAEKEPYSGDMVELKGLLEQCKEGDIETVLELNPFRLVHVYFDFDKATLRLDESLEDLQKLKNILADNPNYSAELRGHTDSRGRKRYNKRLSNRRAKAVVKWLANNGVDKDRLVAVGLGETQLINNCADNVPCSELEHQLNRRTEFKLISKVIDVKEINSSGLKQPRVDPCTNCPHEPQP